LRFWSQSAAVRRFSYDAAANFILGGKVMLDHKKKAITEHWQFCPKCNLKLYRMTANCTGFIHIKCWRCRKMLWLDLSMRAK